LRAEAFPMASAASPAATKAADPNQNELLWLYVTVMP
jgi:hypothetical protein